MIQAIGRRHNFLFHSLKEYNNNFFFLFLGSTFSVLVYKLVVNTVRNTANKPHIVTEKNEAKRKKQRKLFMFTS